MLFRSQPLGDDEVLGVASQHVSDAGGRQAALAVRAALPGVDHPQQHQRPPFLQPGDKILKVDGQPVKRFEGLVDMSEACSLLE